MAEGGGVENIVAAGIPDDPLKRRAVGKPVHVVAGTGGGIRAVEVLDGGDVVETGMGIGEIGEGRIPLPRIPGAGPCRGTSMSKLVADIAVNRKWS